MLGADAGLEHRFVVLALDRKTGKTLWERTARTATPHEGFHRTYGSFASNSPVTDGERVFAFFGSRSLYAYSLDGALLWEKDFNEGGVWHVVTPPSGAPAGASARPGLARSAFAPHRRCNRTPRSPYSE